MNTATVTRHWNIPWLHDLPDHWQVVSSKRLFAVRKELARPDDEQLSATQAYGVIPQREFERRVGRRVVQITQNFEKRRHVERDDFVISMRSFEGGLERAWATGCIRSSYVVLKPSEAIDVNFFQYLFKSHNYIQALRATSNFIRDGQDLNISNFSLVDLPLPPKSEQKLMARYLGHVDSQIRKLIRAKKKLIALLNEQKQAVIHRVVTRGLDPNVKLERTAIPWIGMVPDGWQVVPLKRVTISRCDGPFGSGLKSSHYTSHGVLVVRLQNIGSGDYKATDPAFISREHYRSLGDHSVVSGDVLVASLGDERHPCGRACVAPADLGEAMVKADCFRFRLKPELANSHFVAMSLSATAEESAAILSAGATRQRVNLQATAERYFALPPIDDQIKIVHHLAAVNEEFQPLLSSTNREITLIQEFRMRLIADVVTGKLDVRAAAARLPEATNVEIGDETIEPDEFAETDDLENEEAAA
jgi:type I restriction enzyme S subunit